MKILDKYILKQYFQTFFFSVLLFIPVICVIDYAEKSEDFVKNKAPMKAILIDYFGSFAPFIINALSPIFVFLSTVWVVSRLAARTEVIAMLSSGMSFLRFMTPFFAGSVVLGGMIFYLVGWAVPITAKRKIAFENQYYKNPFYFEGRNVHYRVSDSTYVYLESYNNISNTGFKFTLEHIENNTLLRKLSADVIQWDTLRKKWHLDRYTEYTFDGIRETVHYGMNMDTVFNLTEKDFQSDHGMEEMLTMVELDSYIADLRLRGADNVNMYLNVKYERYAYPFAIVILTMMGVIISARKSRRGTGYQIAFGVALAFAFILFVFLSRSVAQANANVSPLLLAFIPNITFACITLFMYFTVPR